MKTGTSHPKKRKGSPSRGAPSGRYTPPKKKTSYRAKRRLLGLIFGSLILGALLIVVNFLAVLPGGESSWYLLLGITLIAVGFAAATRYR